MEACTDNLSALGSKLEQCMNSLPLGDSALIEDPRLMEKQMADLQNAKKIYEEEKKNLRDQLDDEHSKSIFAPKGQKMK